jgi:hypothetical protein
MPYTIVQRGEQYCVFKVGADEQPTGDTLGCHDTAQEAGAQIAAIERAENSLQMMCNGAVGTVRREIFDGREFLVAPVIAIRTGVLNNELISEEEAGRHVEAWNGRPWVVDHPEIDGISISANDPAILEQQRIGWVFGAHWVDDRLKAEVWTDIEKAKQVPGGEKVLLRLQSGDPLEVSTAYFRDLDETPGKFNGQAYMGIARNLKPDHLAALPDAVGACSWADGCGAPRVNKEGKVEQEATPPVAPAGDLETNRESFVAMVVRKTLSALGIRRNEEERMSKIDKILENEALALVANKDTLAELDEEQLDALLALTDDTSEIVEDDSEDDVEPDQEQEQEQEAGNDSMSELEARVAQLEAQLSANANAEKSALIAELAANKRIGLNAEQLEPLGIDALQALQRKFRPRSFAGQGGGVKPSNGGIVPLKKSGVLLKKEAASG